MAYVFGQVYYQLGSATVRRSIAGDLTLVLVQRGDTWKIRSYVERPRLDSPLR
jgi:hypothetical protein